MGSFLGSEFATLEPKTTTTTEPAVASATRRKRKRLRGEEDLRSTRIRFREEVTDSVQICGFSKQILIRVSPGAVLHYGVGLEIHPRDGEKGTCQR